MPSEISVKFKKFLAIVREYRKFAFYVSKTMLLMFLSMFYNNIILLKRDTSMRELVVSGCYFVAFVMAFLFYRRLGAKGSYLTLVRVADRIL